MMQGQRFELDLDPEEAYEQFHRQQRQASGPSSVEAPKVPTPQEDNASFPLPFVKDVLEHNTPTTAPLPPSLKPSGSGFPAPRKRMSRFKQAKGNTQQDRAPDDVATVPKDRLGSSSSESPAKPGSYLSRMAQTSDAEKQDIDRQTTAMIDGMSADELRDAREEILSDPSFAAIQRLLKRANIDPEDTMKGDPVARLAENNGLESTSGDKLPRSGSKEVPDRRKKVTFTEEPEVGKATAKVVSSRSQDAPSSSKSRAVPNFSPSDIKPVSTSLPSYRTPFYRSKYDGVSLADAASDTMLPTSSQLERLQQTPTEATKTHEQTNLNGADAEPSNADRKFPTLDPNSSTFLSDLHETYFPDIPADTRSLAWMAPVEAEEGPTDDIVSPEDTPKPADKIVNSSTTNTTARIRPENLRFDFRGAIVSPERSNKIPVTKGLHHHGREPGAAGYTITELAMYERSTSAPQRCFAYQLLGRLLYRLGIGDLRLGGPLRNSNNGSDNGSTDVDPGIEKRPLDAREEGLWREIKRNHVLEGMLVEAGRQPGTGSESARMYAIEAVWLWKKAGARGLEDIQDDEAGEVMGEAAERIFEEGLNPVF